MFQKLRYGRFDSINVEKNTQILLTYIPSGDFLLRYCFSVNMTESLGFFTWTRPMREIRAVSNSCLYIWLFFVLVRIMKNIIRNFNCNNIIYY